ncbi:MAG: tRNA (adenosine(37)-N6)-dimethylallyltransferase MiaA [Parcubacteria group bacterium]|nr:tRNA (adenosine(37)-N6)-dimethylallyltransferase MiaA [Parcubacteria group bacterium]
MNKKLPPLVVILGPTGSGKTSLSLKLAKKYNGEIISSDSRQIYKEMDIATDKIKKQNSKFKIKNSKIKKLYYGNVNNIPHYMIDIINPDEEYSVANYKKDALLVINDILKRGKIPFLVGGTGLYIKVIVNNLNIPKIKPNRALRKKLDTMSKEKLFSILKRLDPKGAKKIDKNNKRRLVRAIEICKQTGKKYSEQNQTGKQLFNALQIGIRLPREELYKKIDKRVDELIKIGLIDETKKLMEKYSFTLPSMSGIGYKEIGEYLNNKISKKEAIQKIKYRTHQYVRRQDTWFLKDKKIEWIKNYRKR